MEASKGLKKFLSSFMWGMKEGGKPPSLLYCHLSSSGLAPIT